MPEPVEERRGHFSVTEYAGPFGKGEAGHDSGGCAFVKATDEVKEKLSNRSEQRADTPTHRGFSITGLPSALTGQHVPRRPIC